MSPPPEVATPSTTTPATGLTAREAAARLLRDGPNDVPEPRAHPLQRFLRRFWGLSAWMVELIALLSLLLRRRADFVIAVALLLLNAVMGFVQEQRASAAVAALRSRLKITSRVLRDARWSVVPATQLVTGDVVRLRAGDFVPADARIAAGSLQVDESALTGESRELEQAIGATVHSGAVVRQGEATAVVSATGTRTSFGRTAQLVQSAHPKLRIEAVVARIVRWLFVIVAVQVALATAVALARGMSLLELAPLVLVLLLSAIPVALPVMFTVSMAVGAMELGRRGVLVSRLSAAEDAANLDMLCADKTGTLTANRLSLAGALPEAGCTQDDVVRDGAAASNESNQDAIDLAFLRAAETRQLLTAPADRVSFLPFSASMRRTEAVVHRQGRPVRVVKGAVRVVGSACGLDPAAIADLEARVAEAARGGQRAIAVARAAPDEPLRLVGVALLADSLRPDSPRLVAELRALGVGIRMLTGDALAVAQETARALQLGTVIRATELRQAAGESDAAARALVLGSGGVAEVYPEDKFRIVKDLQSAGHVVGMTGDGVNDAPALRQAEVGIAVSTATDVAKGAASVVLTTEGLDGIVDLVRNGRAIYQRVLTWIINKVSRTILKSGFVVLAYLLTGRFVVTALGMVLLVFMTDFAKIALSTDRVRPSRSPESWNIGPLLRLAALLGVLMLAESLALLAFGWHRLDLAHRPGALQTFSFQALLFFAVFSLVSVRERRSFLASRPGGLLSAALLLDLALAVLIGLRGLADMQPLPLGETALIALYAAACCLGPNDWIKQWLVARATAARRAD